VPLAERTTGGEGSDLCAHIADDGVGRRKGRFIDQLNYGVEVTTRGVHERKLGTVLFNPFREGFESVIVAFGEEGVIYVADKNDISSRD
jgi:hypothetical protein